MKDEVPRLIDDARASPSLRRALEQAQADGPRPAELDALLAAVVGPGPAGGAGQPPAAPSGSAPGSAGGTLSASATVKLGALALLSGAALVGVFMVRSDPARVESQRAPARTRVPEAAAPAPRETPDPAPAPRTAPVLDAGSSGPGDEARRVEKQASLPRTGSVTTGPKAERDPEALPAQSSRAEPPAVSDAPAVVDNPVLTQRVSSELELLNRAERLLVRDSAQAFELTQLHRREFPAGRLAEEREVIAIEALVRLGQHDGAARRFSLFERRFAGSVHRPRLKQLLGSSRP